MPSSKKTRRKKMTPVKKSLRTLLLIAVGLSALQFLQQGTVTWPANLYRNITTTIGDYADRPSAGWRRASDGLDKLGGRREGQPVPTFDLSGRAVKIMDGDTLSLLDSEKRQHTIRLFGIDTPEWNQPHGSSAKKALARLVDGRNIGVVKVDTDTFGRTVGTVYVGDSNVNLALVESGHAWWFARYAPYERHLAAAEEQAREARIGLWAGQDPIPPWRWRREHRR